MTTIDTGFHVWTNWSEGRILGATITLSARDGALLLSAIAVFVAWVTSQLWILIRFAIHQHLARRVCQVPRDGLYFQQRAILRNAAVPTQALLQFLGQAWYWRRAEGIDRLFGRTLPMALLAIGFSIAAALLSIFSSLVSSSAGDFRLLVPSSCGLYGLDPSAPPLSSALGEIDARFNDAAAVYENRCYNESLRDSSLCQEFPVPSLAWESMGEQPCPFGSLCSARTDGMAYRVSSAKMDSHQHLGMNTPPSDRVQYQRQLTCAPLRDDRGIFEINPIPGAECRRLQLNYGPRLYEDGSVAMNYTFHSNKCALDSRVGYNVELQYSRPGATQTWTPLRELDLADADTVIMFISLDALSFTEPNSDPVFGTMDREFPEPRALANILAYAAYQTDTYQTIYTRTRSFLKASERVLLNHVHLPLPDDQWEREVESLLTTSLARLQLQVAAYPDGDSVLLPNIVLRQPWETTEDPFLPALTSEEREAERQLCSQQRTRLTKGTLNFSVVGLVLTFALGVIIIMLSYALPDVVYWIRKRWNLKPDEAAAWWADENLQVLRVMFQARGLGDWIGEDNMVPTTRTSEKLASAVNGAIVVHTQCHPGGYRPVQGQQHY
ncbi:uncharacterized protein J7T54_005369 [Emericellopsis cladophorae]|uniref:Uncharacterized protein n=1 Tax=Emericellopsis cladophorae TaxID=2686198 RepID=A0A9P9XTY4_9HYPO|nr:uncharacterized protein J7T54_005369 [Emericellopsis cladophorae]KAI6777700.1 hypothetical protein J7T54_005369 [Emericellopsis cladophorae]